MKTFVIAALLAVVASPRVIYAADAKISVAGIRIGEKVPEGVKDILYVHGEGTRLMMYLEKPGQVFIGVERDACKFELFTDDKGTDLFGPLGHAPDADDWLGAFGPKISENGKYCCLEVQAPGLPAKDATKIRFSGTLMLNCGSAPKTVEQKNVPLKKGSKITVGPVQFDISSVKPDGNGLIVDLHARKSLERIIKFAFFDAAGKPIGGTRDSMESSYMLGIYNITETYKLSRKVPSMTVKISYFDKVENIAVPVQAETGLGIGP